MRILVKDMMTTPVVTAETGSTIAAVRELMERKGVNAIPIVAVENGDVDVKGIITASDLRGVMDESIPADEIMTTQVQVIPVKMSVQSAAAAMLRNDVHHLLVVEKGKIAGMISSLDFARLVAEQKINTVARAILW